MTQKIKKRKKKDLAEAAGIIPSYLSQILAGARPSWKTAKKLARITGSDPTRWADGDTAYMMHVVDRYIYTYGDTGDSQGGQTNEDHQAA